MLRETKSVKCPGISNSRELLPTRSKRKKKGRERVLRPRENLAIRK